MHIKLKELAEYKVHSVNKEIGNIVDFYFDEDLWAVRYIIVNTGNWLLKDLVLISPVSVEEINDEEKIIKTNITEEQLEKSPDFEGVQPISREKEMEFSDYYRMGYYWTGYDVWGFVPFPINLRNFYDLDYQQNKINQIHQEDNCIRSMNEVVGYHIQTKTGELGHVEDMIMNKRNWVIESFVLNTHNILPGKDVQFSTRWIDKISWDTKKVYVKYKKELVEK